MTDTILETKNLSKKHRVHDLSMSVPKSCVYGFLGPNGAGKSTTLKMILGLIKKDSGEIKLFGEKVSNKNLLNLLHQTGSLIENPGGYPHLTGLENMQIIAKLKGVKEAEIEKALKTVRLYEQRDKKLAAYSLGMKQRLGIAMALQGNPKLLILDEPTAGLDPGAHKEILRMIEKIHSAQNNIIIFVSHNMSDVAEMADRVLVMDEGKILMMDTPKVVFSRHEELNAIGLDIPPVTELMNGIADCGADVPANVLNIEDAKTALLAYLKNKSAGDDSSKPERGESND